MPRKENVKTYFEREVKPHLPDAWVDEARTKDGYEIPFSRPLLHVRLIRPVSDIEADIRALEDEIQGMSPRCCGEWGFTP